MTNDVNKTAELAFSIGQFEAAITYAKQSFKSDRQNADILVFIARAYANLAEYAECAKFSRKALKIQNFNTEALCLLGIALEEKGKHHLAAQYFQKAKDLSPEDLNYRFNVAMQNFRNGNFIDFLEDYGARYAMKDSPISVPGIAPNFSEMSRVQDTSKINLMIFPEQGIGDEIFYCGLIPEFCRKFAGKICVVCDSRLISLFSRTHRTINYISNVEQVHSLIKIDYEMAMGDLLLHAGTENFDRVFAGLVPDAKQKANWEGRIHQLRKGASAVVGISWRGGGAPRMTKSRSISLVELVRNIPEEIALVNLQYDYTIEELNTAEKMTSRKIWNWESLDPRQDIDGLASLISNLDAVVTVDNATAHLSGALKVPTVTLLPINPDFRWKLKHSYSEFYPTVQLLRQKSFGNWNVLKDIPEVLSSTLQN